MKLLTEQVESELQILNEDSGSGSKLFISGVFMEANRKNHNRRIYPKNILEDAVTGYINTKVSKGRAIGELGHPEGPKINLDRVSHRIVHLEWRDDDVMGKALILDTAMGKIAKGLIEGGTQLGVSSRGLGNVNKRSSILEEYWLSTVDIVHDPSAPSAFVDGIMEGVEWIWDNGLLKPQKVEAWQEEISKAPLKRLAEAQERVFADFLKNC